MKNYMQINSKANYILIGKEMDGRCMTAAYLFNRRTGRRERVVHSKFMDMAARGSLVNCKASGGSLFGLQCNLRDIPAYDKKTGAQRSGTSVEAVLTYVNQLMIEHELFVVGKLRFKGKIIAYVVQDRFTGNRTKFSKEAMYKAYSKGYLRNCKVTVNNGEIKVYDGDVGSIPVIDVDSTGTPIDPEKERIERENQIEHIKLEERDEGNRRREGLAIEQISLEGIERGQRSLEREQRSLGDGEKKYIITKKFYSYLSGSLYAYELTHIVSKTTREVDLVHLGKLKRKINFSASEDSASTVYRTPIAELDAYIDDYCDKNSITADIRNRMMQLVSKDVLACMEENALRDSLYDTWKRVQNNTDYRIHSVTFRVTGGVIKLDNIDVLRAGKQVKLSEEEYYTLWENSLVNGPSIIELSQDSLVVKKEYTTYIKVNTEIGKVVQELVKGSNLSDASRKRVVRKIEKELQGRERVYLKTLYNLVEEEVDTLYKKDRDVLKKKYRHCISELDLKDIKTQLLTKVVDGEASLFCEGNTGLKIVITPYSGRKITNIKYKIVDDVLFIGTKESYATILPDCTWLDLLGYVLINIALTYGSYTDVRVQHESAVLIDGNVTIPMNNTINLRKSLGEEKASISEIESLLYNHINAELVRRIGISTKISFDEVGLKNLYIEG